MLLTLTISNPDNCNNETTDVCNKNIELSVHSIADILPLLRVGSVQNLSGCQYVTVLWKFNDKYSSFLCHSSSTVNVYNQRKNTSTAMHAGQDIDIPLKQTLSVTKPNLSCTALCAVDNLLYVKSNDHFYS